MKTRFLNNDLMHASTYDQDRVYSRLRSLRNAWSKAATSILESPAGTYFGNDVLEGFAADAEYLGKPTQDNIYFDIEFL